MPVTLNEKLIAYLTLLTGLSISAVAIYYSVVGLTAIFAAAVVPIIIMGAVLEISKLVATVWLKQNWSIAPWSIRFYLLSAIFILMLITSMGIFGFLSKSHSDQGLVSGEVIARIAVYDEKIKTAKENIEAARRALKQMDEAVDQTMARSTSENGADKAVALRRSQVKERARLFAEIDIEQKKIAQLNEARAPIAAEVRKVEAEVGPLKYIASFIYGETDQSILERAVVWVIILIVVVFDPLAVILLLASQISFQNFKERSRIEYEKNDEPKIENKIDTTEKTEPEETILKEVELSEPVNVYQEDNLEPEKIVFSMYPYQDKNSINVGSLDPMIYIPKDEEAPTEELTTVNEVINVEQTDLEKARELQQLVKDHGFSSQSGIVKIHGLTFSLDEFERLMNIPLEESIIDQTEYFSVIKNKQG